MSRPGGRSLHEECGVLGIYSLQPAALAETAYYGLLALQHRGQESAGLAVSGGGCFRQRRDAGLVSDVFDTESLRELGESRTAVGHVRYSTTGGEIKCNVQPIIIEQSPEPLALAHNGNLTNAAALRLELELDGIIFQTSTDSEIIACLIARERTRHADIIEAAAAAMARLEGAYSLVFSVGDRLTVCRDPFGFRPLCMGRDKAGRLYFASESCALETMGAELERELLPGEILSIGPEGLRTDRRYCGVKPRRLCVFEYIYFARPDSVIEGTSVSAARQRAGRLLARESPVAADLVIGVPDSGLEGALGYSA
ncbi:MAG: amidophosphoribosyltransferase, partial [Firmicutes bacterium]|nr:amidophosphoribosyltransferase [Bacillota bacterium]